MGEKSESAVKQTQIVVIQFAEAIDLQPISQNPKQQVAWQVYRVLARPAGRSIAQASVADAGREAVALRRLPSPQPLTGDNG